MTGMTTRIGALCWGQYTDWPSLFGAGLRADDLGFDSLWTWDHLYPCVGSSDGPIYEGWLTMAAWATATKRASVGLMVVANTFRNPALVAKMATTLDHISGGRAVLGIGAGWFEPEHLAFGLPFGSGPPERLRWLAEALPIVRGMLSGEQPTAPAGSLYQVNKVRNDPLPLRPHLPVLIAGGGEKVTLKLVAKYGDANNFGFAGGFEMVKAKDAILREHCEAIGRDEREIERTAGIRAVVIRDSRDEAKRVQAAIAERNGHAPVWESQPVGTPEDVVEMLAPYGEIGYRHLIFNFPAPYDEETMTRLATEVRPKL